MLIYSMGVSLDGYVAGPNGEIDWSAPDPALHQFHNDQTRELDAHLCGRRLYETMVYWETADDVPAPVELEFARVWQALPKIVFSTTLTSVEGNARLAAGGLAEELAGLDGRVAIGGAALAAEAARLGLIDEYGLFVSPVVLGGGTPFFAPGVRLDLELVETRAFGQTLYLRYRSLSSKTEPGDRV
jgi:dihydrofolate reductase